MADCAVCSGKRFFNQWWRSALAHICVSCLQRVIEDNDIDNDNGTDNHIDRYR